VSALIEAVKADAQAMLSPTAVAGMFGVTERTLRTWVAVGEFPAPVQVRRRLYWRPETVQDVLNGRWQPKRNRK
jgi:hypothetical protein